jgi:hypothetical protein
LWTPGVERQDRKTVGATAVRPHTPSWRDGLSILSYQKEFPGQFTEFKYKLTEKVEETFRFKLQFMWQVNK